MKVMLVDDDRMQVSALERWLHMGKHEVCWAQSGGSALMLLEQEAHFKPVELAIIDVYLGDSIDGIDLCSAMRRHPVVAIKACAVVILSGDSPSSVRRMADAKSSALLSTRAIMQKPLDLQKLHTLMEIIAESAT